MKFTHLAGKLYKISLVFVRKASILLTQSEFSLISASYLFILAVQSDKITIFWLAFAIRKTWNRWDVFFLDFLLRIDTCFYDLECLIFDWILHFVYNLMYSFFCTFLFSDYLFSLALLKLLKFLFNTRNMIILMDFIFRIWRYNSNSCNHEGTFFVGVLGFDEILI